MNDVYELVRILSIIVIPISVALITYFLQKKNQEIMFSKQNEQQRKLLKEKWMNRLRDVFADFLKYIEMIRLEGTNPKQLNFDPNLRSEALKHLTMIKVLLDDEKNDEKEIITNCEKLLKIVDGNKNWEEYKKLEDNLILNVQNKLKKIWKIVDNGE